MPQFFTLENKISKVGSKFVVRYLFCCGGRRRITIAATDKKTLTYRRTFQRCMTVNLDGSLPETTKSKFGTRSNLRSRFQNFDPFQTGFQKIRAPIQNITYSLSACSFDHTFLADLAGLAACEEHWRLRVGKEGATSVGGMCFQVRTWICGFHLLGLLDHWFLRRL